MPRADEPDRSRRNAETAPSEPNRGETALERRRIEPNARIFRVGRIDVKSAIARNTQPVECCGPKSVDTAADASICRRSIGVKLR